MQETLEVTTQGGAVQEMVTQEAVMKPLQKIKRDRSALPLSYAQQRLWFLDQLEPGSTAYNIPGSMHMKGDLNIAAMEQALSEVIRRHEALRTSFPIINGQPVQAIAAPQHVALPVRDLSSLPESERMVRAEQLKLEDAMQPFDLARGPLVRVQLLRLAADEHILLPSMHHIISDGWSLSIFLGELTTLYKAFAKGEPSPLPELEIQYADFAEWQREYLRGEVLEQQLAYWRKQLADAPPAIELPTDKPRPALQSMHGATHRVFMSRDLGERLHAFSRAEGVTLYMTLLAAFNVLLARYTGQDEIVVGSPIAGRALKETEPLIGHFLNTLVLRTDLSGEPTFSELVKRVREVTLEAYAHQDVPFERLVEELQPARDLSRSPLFQVMFILLNMPTQKFELPGLSLIESESRVEMAKFELTLTMMETERGLVAALEYNTDLFESATIKRMVSHFEQLLETICSDAEQPITRLSLMTDEERHELLIKQNQTTAEYPREICMHELIEHQAAQTPELVAVMCGDEQLTYKELNERANQLGRHLKNLGVKPDALVGVLLERSIEMVVGVLGILKAGGAYVPLDPMFPAERLRFMIEDAGVRVLVTQAGLAETMPAPLAGQLAAQGTKVICLDRDWSQIAAESTADFKSDAAAESLAYVIYTSGSTGRPKGVMIEHRSLVNFLCSMQREPGLTAEDSLVAVTTLSFDIAGLELYLPLITGARVVIAQREEVIDAGALQRLLNTSEATVMQATPASWRMLIEGGWAGKKELKVLCGGEALSRELADQLVERSQEVWNMYGPTETTIWSSVKRIKADGRAISLGHPIANTTMYVLNEHLQLVPRGVAGELYIGGEGLARGYFNRAELTEERFVADPFSHAEGARMYRTGDRARWRTEDELEYLGRTDYQVKIRGYRIESGEIEALLAEHPAVGQAVVVVREDVAGDKRLVAYVVPVSGNSQDETLFTDNGRTNGSSILPSTSEWREYLRERLPEYMVPSAFVTLMSLPLTPNGKVDRKQLLAPDEQRPDLASNYVAPQSEIEQQLAAIWREALRVEQVGRYDNFFDLGGHSLLMAQVHSRLQAEFKREVSMVELFRYPTINSLASFLSQEHYEEPKVEQALQRAGMRLNAVRRQRHLRQ